MARSLVFALSAMMLLAGCKTAPTDPRPGQTELSCPSLPALDPLPEAARVPSYTAPMRSFLSGTLPSAKSSDSTTLTSGKSTSGLGVRIPKQ